MSEYNGNYNNIHSEISPSKELESNEDFEYDKKVNVKTRNIQSQLIINQEDPHYNTIERKGSVSKKSQNKQLSIEKSQQAMIFSPTLSNQTPGRLPSPVFQSNQSPTENISSPFQNLRQINEPNPQVNVRSIFSNQPSRQNFQVSMGNTMFRHQDELDQIFLQNNESVKELRENRYRMQSRKLIHLKKDLQQKNISQQHTFDNNMIAFRGAQQASRENSSKELFQVPQQIQEVLSPRGQEIQNKFKKSFKTFEKKGVKKQGSFGFQAGLPSIQNFAGLNLNFSESINQEIESSGLRLGKQYFNKMVSNIQNQITSIERDPSAMVINNTIPITSTQYIIYDPSFQQINSKKIENPGIQQSSKFLEKDQNNSSFYITHAQVQTAKKHQTSLNIQFQPNTQNTVQNNIIIDDTNDYVENLSFEKQKKRQSNMTMKEFIIMKASKFSDCGITRPQVLRNRTNYKEIHQFFQDGLLKKNAKCFDHYTILHESKTDLANNSEGLPGIVNKRAQIKLPQILNMRQKLKQIYEEEQSRNEIGDLISTLKGSEGSILQSEQQNEQKVNQDKVVNKMISESIWQRKEWCSKYKTTDKIIFENYSEFTSLFMIGKADNKQDVVPTDLPLHKILQIKDKGSSYRIQNSDLKDFCIDVEVFREYATMVKGMSKDQKTKFLAIMGMQGEKKISWQKFMEMNMEIKNSKGEIDKQINAVKTE